MGVFFLFTFLAAPSSLLLPRRAPSGAGGYGSSFGGLVSLSHSPALSSKSSYWPTWQQALPEAPHPPQMIADSVRHLVGPSDSESQPTHALASYSPSRAVLAVQVSHGHGRRGSKRRATRAPR